MARVRLGIYLGRRGCKLGPGKVELLRSIRNEGSISGAARSMRMAYRHAWVLVDELNRCFDEPVVIATIGGREGGGATLTPWGEELIERFQHIEQLARGSIEQELSALDARLARGGSVPSRRRRRRTQD